MTGPGLSDVYEPMAEYLPLIERAVAGLSDPTAEARRTIYDRARGALIGQLRGMRPPIPELDIARESAALDEAIARVEAMFVAARTGRPASGGPAPASIGATAPPAAARPSIPAEATAAATAPSIAPLPQRERPSFAPRPPVMPAGKGRTAVAPGPAAVQPRAEPPAGTNVAGAPPAVVRPAMPIAPRIGAVAADRAGAPITVAPGTTPSGVILPAAPTLEVPNFAPAVGPALDRASPTPGATTRVVPGRDPDGPSRRVVDRPADDRARPAAPRPAREPARRVSAWLVAGLAAVLMVGFGVLAWTWRDKPAQLLAARRAEASSDTAGKVSGRADNPPASSGVAGATPDAAASPGSRVAPVPVGESGVDEVTTPSQAPASSGQGAPAPDQGSVAVSQRAALLVDAPDEPQKVKTYVGTVVWTSDSVSPGQGQPLSTAVRADIDVPEAKLKMSMVLKKNPEPQLPASHTMEFGFVPQPGGTLGGVKQINVPEMRKDDDPTGEPLQGLPVRITDNLFLVGLSRGTAAEKSNLLLISERNWFDVSVLLVSGKIGKVTFEKGIAGQRTLEAAMKSWQ